MLIFIYVSDLLNKDGTFVSFGAFKHINPRTNFQEYAVLKLQLRTDCILKINIYQTYKRQYRPIIPDHISFFY